MALFAGLKKAQQVNPPVEVPTQENPGVSDASATPTTTATGVTTPESLPFWAELTHPTRAAVAGLSQEDITVLADSSKEDLPGLMELLGLAGPFFLETEESASPVAPPAPAPVPAPATQPATPAAAPAAKPAAKVTPSATEPAPVAPTVPNPLLEQAAKAAAGVTERSSPTTTAKKGANNRVFETEFVGIITQLGASQLGDRTVYTSIIASVTGKTGSYGRTGVHLHATYMANGEPVRELTVGSFVEVKLIDGSYFIEKVGSSLPIQAVEVGKEFGSVEQIVTYLLNQMKAPENGIPLTEENITEVLRQHRITYTDRGNITLYNTNEANLLAAPISTSTPALPATTDTTASTTVTNATNATNTATPVATTAPANTVNTNTNTNSNKGGKNNKKANKR